jgi:heptosyltransferase-2
MGIKILIISLDALGNVLDNTPILHALKRKYPVSTIYWLTLENAQKILFNNHLIDKVYSWNDENRMILRNMEFDFVMNADKSVYAAAFTNETKAKQKLGFLLNEDGKIIPANDGALYSYRLGLDDKFKFRDNTRTQISILHDTFELEYNKDECIYNFTPDEIAFISNYKMEIEFDSSKVYVGFNTGCSELFSNKKMTVDQHVKIIRELIENENHRVVLLGGREDTERNNAIYGSFDDDDKEFIINTPTTEGIRKGACYMNVPHIIISGDSFGMHLAIALKKYVIAWFGLSCASEIELYGRGEKLIPQGLECSPCWKQDCPYDLECISMIDLKKIISLVNDYTERNKTKLAFNKI